MTETLLLKLDRQRATPLPQQIVGQIVRLIENGTLQPGTALPPTRALASVVGVNRVTVVRAYRDLWVLGYTESRPGSYTTVRRRVRLVTPAARRGHASFDWSSRSTPDSQRCLEEFRERARRNDGRAGAPDRSGTVGRVIDFLPHFFTPDDMPVLDRLRQCLNQALANRGDEIVGRPTTAGYGPLRHLVANRLQRFCIPATDDEVLLTNGPLHAMELVLRTLGDRSRPAVVESPTAPWLLSLLRQHRIETIGIPMTAAGMDLAVLRTVLARRSPFILYTMPNFHVPTGIMMPQAQREELLSLCQRHDLPIIEEGFEEELACLGRPGLPIQSMDRRRIVIHLGSFSRIMFLGGAVGWLAADRCLVERLAAVKARTGAADSTLLQAGIEEFCRQGHYDLYVRRMLAAFRKRMTTALRALRQQMPRELMSWDEPDGGYTIWLTLRRPPRGTSATELFRQHGVIVAAGRPAFPRPVPDRYVQLSISSVNEAQIVAGVRRMAAAVRRHYAR